MVDHSRALMWEITSTNYGWVKVCFLAGNLALGATRGLTKQQAVDKGLFDAHDAENFQLAEDLAKTCYEMYAVTATGLAPEIVYFHLDVCMQPSPPVYSSIGFL